MLQWPRFLWLARAALSRALFAATAVPKLAATDRQSLPGFEPPVRV
jgi:hypothetical protein